MVTRIRVEAEGRSTQEVEDILYCAHEVLVQRADRTQLNLMFGREDGEADDHPALADAQAGELVIERFARDTDGEAGHGAIFWRGRMTAHFARPQKALRLDRHHGEPTIHIAAAD